VTSTTEAILQEDGAEAALNELAERVQGAEIAIRDLVLSDKSRIWTIRELQDTAANGWSSSVMSIAFLRLLQGGELLRVDSDLRVHAL
jgi:hypothetical protein